MSDRNIPHEPCELLPWDSQFFGIQVARVIGNRLTPEGCDQIDAFCRREQVDCLYFLGRSDDAALTCLAAARGFDLVDVRVVLNRQLKNSPPLESSPYKRFLTRPARPSDLPRLQAIAQVSHRESRFYFDSHFSRERCDALYRQWITRDWETPGNAILVADREGLPIGYATCTVPSHRVGRIGLVAVDPAARGAGVGQALVEEAISLFARQDLGEVRVVTQGRNIAAQRLYQAAADSAPMKSASTTTAG